MLILKTYTNSRLIKQIIAENQEHLSNPKEKTIIQNFNKNYPPIFTLNK